VIIEGLLSVDNALAIAAMAAHLPEKQKYMALRLGIFGAYFFRGISMACAAWIIENPWLKIGGSAYLLYLMAEHFSGAGGTDPQKESETSQGRGFWATIFAIELMDLSLSVDNVVAAVAMSPKLWVVCTGVFIGILALRFVAGFCIRLIEKFPVLEHTAFLLVGYVGGILMVELLSDSRFPFSLFPAPVHISTIQKFLGILCIVLVSIVYARVETVRKVLEPLLRITRVPLGWIAGAGAVLMSGIILPFRWMFRAG
jgi:YkoY family integral membrane protein